MVFQWKQEDVLLSEGDVVKAGTWHGNNVVDNKPYVSTFTNSDVRKIYDRIPKGLIPIYVDLHGRRGDRSEPDGYAMSFGISEDSSKIAHKGFVYNLDAQKAIVSGDNECSPEFSTLIDSKGNADRTLTALCYIPNSAMKNDVNFMFEKFEEAPEKGADKTDGNAGNISGQDQKKEPGNDAKDKFAGLFDGGKKAEQAPVEVDYNKIVSMTIDALKPFLTAGGNTTPGVSDGGKKEESKGGDNVDKKTIKQDGGSDPGVDALKSRLDEQGAMLDGMMDEKIEALVNQIKGFGVSDPMSLIPAGASKKGTIEFLTKTKDLRLDLIKLNGVPQNLGGGESSKASRMEFEKTMTELGFGDKHYTEMFPEMYQ